MIWVLRRIEDGQYVARPGSKHSYTKRLSNAQTFWTRSDAEANACGNERAVRVDCPLK